MTATSRWQPPAGHVPRKSYPPAMPLADAVLRMAEREGLNIVCARAGIAERTVTRWRHGEGNGGIAVDLADQVMTNLGLFWWEIWTVDTVREPLFVVTTYNSYLKLGPDGKRKRRRLKDRTIPYGDLGTDFYRLREIETLMRGSLEMAA